MKEGCEIMPINENTLEQVIISELQEKGYEYLNQLFIRIFLLG